MHDFQHLLQHDNMVCSKMLAAKAQLPWLSLQLRQHVLFPPDKPEDPSSINTP